MSGPAPGAEGVWHSELFAHRRSDEPGIGTIGEDQVEVASLDASLDLRAGTTERAKPARAVSCVSDRREPPMTSVGEMAEELVFHAGGAKRTDDGFARPDQRRHFHAVFR